MRKFYIITILVGMLITSCQNNGTKRNEVSKEKEHKILKELRRDLSQNLEDINENLSSLKISERANKITIDLIENKKPYHDSLNYHFANLHPYLVFSPNETTFGYLKQKGLTLISNDSIRSSLSNLYGVQYGIYKDFERIYFVEHYTNYVKPMFMAEFKTFKFYRSFKPRNYNQFIANTEYKRTMTYTVDAIETFIFMQSGLKEEVEKLILEIEQELIR